MENKGERGGRLGSGPVMQFRGVHTENGSASVAAKTMGISRYARPAGRRKEKERAASAVTAVTAVILLYAGNKCAPLTHASAIAAFPPLLFARPSRARTLATCSLESPASAHGVARASRKKEGKSRICATVYLVSYTRRLY